MTLREQCEDMFNRLISPIFGHYKDVAIDRLELFAKSQQAVGLREAAKRLDEFNDDMGRFDPHLQKIVEWLEQQAREREGTP